MSIKSSLSSAIPKASFKFINSSFAVTKIKKDHNCTNVMSLTITLKDEQLVMVSKIKGNAED